MITQPESTEYEAYYEKYISLVRGEDILETWSGQVRELDELFGNLAEERGNFAYAEDKWTLKEVLSHIIDGERMFAYRALRISRGDLTPIEGFEQDGYIENARSNERSFADLLDEFELLRVANVPMFNHMSETDWQRSGTASNVGVSVEALAYIMAGHVIHHVNIFGERYAV